MKMSDSQHRKKAVALADKITAKAEETLAALNIEMALKRWSPELRKIMWDAVAQVATAYAESASTDKSKA